jgi:hypothetical protein
MVQQSMIGHYGQPRNSVRMRGFDTFAREWRVLLFIALDHAQIIVP